MTGLRKDNFTTMKRLLNTLMVLLGFVGCDDGSSEDIPVTEYGCPYVSFRAMTRVAESL